MKNLFAMWLVLILGGTFGCASIYENTKSGAKTVGETGGKATEIMNDTSEAGVDVLQKSDDPNPYNR